MSPPPSPGQLSPGGASAIRTRSGRLSTAPRQLYGLTPSAAVCVRALCVRACARACVCVRVLSLSATGPPQAHALRCPEHRSRCVPPTVNISGGFWLFTSGGAQARAPPEGVRRGGASTARPTCSAGRGPRRRYLGPPAPCARASRALLALPWVPACHGGAALPSPAFHCRLAAPRVPPCSFPFACAAACLARTVQIKAVSTSMRRSFNLDSARQAGRGLLILVPTRIRASHLAASLATTRRHDSAGSWRQARVAFRPPGPGRLGTNGATPDTAITGQKSALAEVNSLAQRALGNPLRARSGRSATATCAGFGSDSEVLSDSFRFESFLKRCLAVLADDTQSKDPLNPAALRSGPARAACVPPQTHRSSFTKTARCESAR